MSKIPNIVTRITKHKPPRYQLYQPGFNPCNSCWLPGDWVTVSKQKYDETEEKHTLMYTGIYDEIQNQNHRDPGTLLEAMTPSQKQAYEFFSGTDYVDCLNSLGDHMVAAIRLAGGKISDDSSKEIRKRGWKVIQRIESYGKKTDIDISKFPEDIVLNNTESIDITRKTIDQNKYKNKMIFEALLNSPNASSLPMAMYYLIDLESQIIRGEWYRKYKPDFYDDLEMDILEYADRRKKLKQILKNYFESIYENQKKSHNDCARSNLEGSGRQLFCFVIPKFFDNGTHEPWSENDVPLPNIYWGLKDGN